MSDKDGLKEVTVTLAFNVDELGPQWMNRDNLEMLLYSKANTRRDLLEVTAYSNERPEPKPDWISVEDRLPMEADEGSSAYKCIVAYRSGESFGTSVSWFEFSDESNVGGFSGDVTHWMELPEPPKTRSKDVQYYEN